MAFMIAWILPATGRMQRLAIIRALCAGGNFLWVVVLSGRLWKEAHHDLRHDDMDVHAYGGCDPGALRLSFERRLALDLRDWRCDCPLSERLGGIMQAFEKVPALKAMAPTQIEPLFLVTQVVVLALFIALAFSAVKRSRSESFAA
jgi:hypothetical protein